MGQSINGLEYAMPKNLNLVHCVDAEEWNDSNVMDSTDDLNFRYASEASFDLPLSSATLFLISRGENLGGAVRVVTSEEQADDSAKVLISLRYYEEKVRDWTKVCLLSRDEDEDGVGVFVSDHILARLAPYAHRNCHFLPVDPTLEGRTSFG